MIDITVDDCHEFMRAINAGLRAIDLPTIETLDYDLCEPSNPFECLSARHLFAHADGYVGIDTVLGLAPDVEEKFLNVFGTKRKEDAVRQMEGIAIPPAISRVTDVFDSIDDNPDGDQINGELRALFVEAGYVD